MNVLCIYITIKLVYCVHEIQTGKTTRSQHTNSSIFTLIPKKSLCLHLFLYTHTLSARYVNIRYSNSSKGYISGAYATHVVVLSAAESQHRGVSRDL